MAQIARLPAPRGAGTARAAWRWLTQPRTVRLSPLGALAIAAACVAVVLARPDRDSHPAPGSAREFGFVIVPPPAATVSLVGDFNDWDSARTPMHLARKAWAVWSAVISLSPGRYRYAFLVDGVSR